MMETLLPGGLFLFNDLDGDDTRPSAGGARNDPSRNRSKTYVFQVDDISTFRTPMDALSLFLCVGTWDSKTHGLLGGVDVSATNGLMR
uniref:Uncharacterized protein n=1 Tax=Paracidobacterium acidisoli TaxID=2303751 RepID=A0A372IS66_9BACT